MKLMNPRSQPTAKVSQFGEKANEHTFLAMSSSKDAPESGSKIQRSLFGPGIASAADGIIKNSRTIFATHFEPTFRAKTIVK
jgi:hypothetical protein